MRVFSYALPFSPPVLGHTVRRGLIIVRDDGARTDFAPWPPPQSDVELLERFGKNPPERLWAEANFFDPKAPPVQVKDATLIWPDREQREGGGRAVSLETGGAPVVKLKVRPGDEDLVARLRQSTAAPIRLDGKRTLNMDQARVLAALAAPLDFFEEPTASLEDNMELANSGVAVALDETVREVSQQDAASVLAAAPFAAVVLKATLLGPIETSGWVSAAQRTQTRIIISSVFESAVGRASLHRLAHRIAPDDVHGLGTHRFFAADLAPDEPLESPLLTRIDNPPEAL